MRIASADCVPLTVFVFSFLGDRNLLLDLWSDYKQSNLNVWCLWRERRWLHWRSPWRVDGEGLFCDLVSVHGNFTCFFHDYVIFTCRVHFVVQTCSAWWKRDLSTTGLNKNSSAPWADRFYSKDRCNTKIGTLRSDNGDLHENVTENRLRILSLFSRLFQGAQLLKRGEFWFELKRRDCARVLTEMVEFIALPFPFPSKLKIWSFHVLVMEERQRNVQKSVMHVQSCYFAH